MNVMTPRFPHSARKRRHLARRLATFSRPDQATRQRIDVNEIVRSSASLYMKSLSTPS